ncbi:hypothetical protein UT300012_31310 [Paraclostridium bifermentans]
MQLPEVYKCTKCGSNHALLKDGMVIDYVVFAAYKCKCGHEFLISFP